MCELRGTAACSKSCSMMNHIALSLNSSSRNNNNHETDNNRNTNNNSYVDMNNNNISPCTTGRDNSGSTPRKHDDLSSNSLSSASNDQRKRRKEPTSTLLIKKLKWTIALALCISLMPSIQCQYGSAESSLVGAQNWDRPGGMPKITRLEVMCGAQHMEVHLAFDSPFHGLVASKGMYGQEGCVYVRPRTGQANFVFNIYYDKCGTKPDNHGKFYENTVVVQYDEELIEAWDEAKRLRCEWFNDYEKTATKTNPMVISDLDIVELNFHGDNVDCWMEIQEGKGPWAPPLNGIVPLGSPLTMVVAVKDPTGEFDMRVKACEASDGHGGHVLPLSDPDGCIMRPKLLSKFSKIKLDDGRATVLTYAHINAFKFPDMLNVHLRCTVEICRHGCPNHCSTKYNLNLPQHQNNNKQADPIFNGIPHGPEVLGYESKKNEQAVVPNEVLQKQVESKIPDQPRPPPPQQPEREQEPSLSMHPPQPLPPNHPRPFMIPPHQRVPGPPPPPQRNPMHPGLRRPPPHMPKFPNPQRRPPFPPGYQPNRQGIPAGPENSEPREIRDEAKDQQEAQAEPLKSEPLTSMERDGPVEPSKVPSPRNIRMRRSVSSNSDIIGIQGAFKVISQADLNFLMNPNPNSTQTSMTPQSPVFKGKISEEAIYGICLPRLGFSIVFFGLGLATLVAILIAGFLAYAHYRAILYKKANFKGPSAPTHAHSIINPGARISSNNSNTQHQQQNVLPVPMVVLRKMW